MFDLAKNILQSTENANNENNKKLFHVIKWSMSWQPFSRNIQIFIELDSRFQRNVFTSFCLLTWEIWYTVQTLIYAMHTAIQHKHYQNNYSRKRIILSHKFATVFITHSLYIYLDKNYLWNKHTNIFVNFSPKSKAHSPL